ncbi:YfiR family protein [Vibrio nereis]|uniref:YfiR family protein n=1 Tax=Vibrio nereis TaxID=693 RepID=UPI002493D70A|nr:YfiR family protein [Vibrio nereis]
MSFKSLLLAGSILCAGVSFSVNAKFTPEQVKAVYIYRITSFIQWNDEQQMSRINICVPDDSEVRAILTDITQNKAVRNKPLTITDDQCDVLYITSEENLSTIATNTPNTVLISDIDKFTHLGGVIELANKQGRIKPKVNLDNVGSYSISANFLRVADLIGGAHDVSQ